MRSENSRSLSAVDEFPEQESQAKKAGVTSGGFIPDSEGFTHETDGFTYAVDEDGDLRWFISPDVYYRRRKGEAEAAEPPAKPDS
jgi:hypothetical protein